MPKKTFTPEHYGQAAPDRSARKPRQNRAAGLLDSGITDQTYYRWRKEYGGLQLEQAKKLKDLQKENAQLTPALATLTLENKF